MYEALIKWRNRFGRGCGPVVWQITDVLKSSDVKIFCILSTLQLGLWMYVMHALSDTKNQFSWHVSIFDVLSIFI
jgi:hypothetical protein